MLQKNGIGKIKNDQGNVSSASIAIFKLNIVFSDYPVPGASIDVNGVAMGDNSGSSWTNSYVDLQDG